MIGIESATCAHISINNQQFAPPLPSIATQTSTISTNDCVGQTEHCSHTTVYNTCVPHYSMAGDKPTPLPLSLQDTLHGNSHMLRRIHMTTALASNFNELLCFWFNPLYCLYFVQRWAWQGHVIRQVIHRADC